MPILHNEIRIAASPDAVWAVLGDLASTPEWIPGVVEASVENGRRVCRTADGQEIREQIVDYSEAGRSWGYEQSQVPLPITGSHGTLRVHDDGDGARVVWEASFEVVDPAQEDQLVPMIDGYYRQTLESLRDRIERGPSE
jgi:mxaD protein